MAHPKWVQSVFSEQDLGDIAAAVGRVESSAAAEVRVHLEPRLPKPTGNATPDPFVRAVALFQQLGMHRTRLRNGVLLYLALEDRKLAIVGDEAIHARVGPAYWDRVRDLMVERMRGHAPREAVVRAVEEIGRVLTKHFPRTPGSGGGELSNEVSLH